MYRTNLHESLQSNQKRHNRNQVFQRQARVVCYWECALENENNKLSYTRLIYTIQNNKTTLTTDSLHSSQFLSTEQQ